MTGKTNDGRRKQVFFRAQTSQQDSGISASNNNLKGAERKSRVVWIIRLAFVFSLIAVAIILGCLAYKIIEHSEREIGHNRYEAFADRALDLATDHVLRRRIVVRSMAQIAASAFPYASEWPNVAIPAFDVFAKELLSTSQLDEIGFYPLIKPGDEQSSFEDFAYDYFYNQRSPPFPTSTGVHEFGRGIWKLNLNGTPVHDTTGDTLPEWESPNKVLFPQLQKSDDDTIEGDPLLLKNFHSDKEIGGSIDKVIECAKQRKVAEDQDMECGVVTGISSLTRASYLIHPVYPARDRLEASHWR